MRKKSFAQSLPLIAPAHLLILSVIVMPSIFVVWLSITKSSFGQDPTYVGLENYIRVLGDPAFRRALWNTIAIVVCAVHLELAIGLLIALLFASGLWFRRFLLVAVLAPYAVSEVIAVVMWRFLFDPDAGPITLAMKALGLPILDWSFEPIARNDFDCITDDLAALALYLHHPLRGATIDSQRALRGRAHRWRHASAGIPARDIPSAWSGGHGCAAVSLHFCVPDLL